MAVDLFRASGILCYRSAILLFQLSVERSSDVWVVRVASSENLQKVKAPLGEHVQCNSEGLTFSRACLE
jgi:hypothetical protein